MARLPVAVQEDHIQRLIRNPLAGVAELIWNALDADAMKVSVRLERNALGGLDSVVVEDDGHGMSHVDAQAVFASLGGSWKRYADVTRERKRRLHGSAGEGRFRAFGIPGARIRWESVEPAEQGQLVVVTADRSSLREFEIEEPTPTKRQHGTTVTIEGITEDVPGIDSDQAGPRLTAQFALYLGRYPDIEIRYDGVLLDPSAVQTRRDVYDLSDVAPETQLTVVEWSLRNVDRYIHLCAPEGVALGEVRPGIQAPGFEFSSYLTSPLVVDHATDLGLAEWEHPVLGPVLRAAQEKLRDHFRRRSAQEEKAVIQAWKRDQVYPYEGEPSTAIEEAKRDVFDAVATTAARLVNAATDPSAKRLSLRLMREAIETGPEALRRILREVLDLPEEQINELDQLLHRVSLSAIISASRKIADRLDFIAGLESLVFDETRETLKERSQLHRIIAAEPWIFGEEYALAVDDQSLTTLLRKHIDLLDRDDLVPDEPVVDPEGHRRVDLMLARAIPKRENHQQHLVVELKRPSVSVGLEELMQIKRYAFAVQEDERFDRRRTKWDFIVVSNSLDSAAQQEASQVDREPGQVIHAANLDVWATTWSQVLQDARHRLKYVQDALDYMASHDSGLAYLRDQHAGRIPESVS